MKNRAILFCFIAIGLISMAPCCMYIAGTLTAVKALQDAYGIVQTADSIYDSLMAHKKNPDNRAAATVALDLLDNAVDISKGIDAGKYPKDPKSLATAADMVNDAQAIYQKLR